MSRREFIEQLAVSFAIALASVMLLTFNLAYLNGMSTRVMINKYGEAAPEFLLLTLVVWPVISVAIYYWTLGGDD